MKDLFEFLSHFGIDRHAVSTDERTGPILLVNSEGSEGLFVISPRHHESFEEFIKKNPTPAPEESVAFFVYLLDEMFKTNKEVEEKINQMT